MDFTTRDLILWAYTAGAVVTGIYVDRMLAEFSQPVVISAALVVAVPWLLYYRIAVQPRLDAVENGTQPGAPKEQS